MVWKAWQAHESDEKRQSKNWRMRMVEAARHIHLSVTAEGLGAREGWEGEPKTPRFL
jgi:hypothetical protein